MFLTELESSQVINGVKNVVAYIMTDEKPATMPTDGTDIKGLSASDILAPGSCIITVNGEAALLGENGWGDWL